MTRNHEARFHIAQAQAMPRFASSALQAQNLRTAMVMAETLCALNLVLISLIGIIIII